MCVSLQESEASNSLPLDVMCIIAGEYAGVVRSAGLFTKEDLIKIKKYVKKGLSLPSVLSAVETFLKYQKVDIAGLEPIDIMVLFRDIKFHASGWDLIENRIAAQSDDLNFTADNVLNSGYDIISKINKMPIMDRVRNTLGDLSDTELEEMTFTSYDVAAATTVTSVIEMLKEDIEAQQYLTKYLKDHILNFKVRLAGGELSDGDHVFGLESEVHSKYDLMQRNNLLKSIDEYKDSILTKKERIIQLDKDYKYFVGMAFSGGLPIFWPISASIYGPKAESARKERDSVRAEVEVLELLVSGQENLQHSLESVMSTFGDLGIRMLDAEVGLNILNMMWQTMLNKIDSSAEQFGDINNALKLTSFVSAFTLVLAPWVDVKNIAAALLTVFNEALEEYESIYG